MHADYRPAMKLAVTAWHWLRSHKAHLAFYALAGVAVEKLLTGGYALSVIVLQLALYCLYDAVFPHKGAPCPCNVPAGESVSVSKDPLSPTF